MELSIFVFDVFLLYSQSNLVESVFRLDKWYGNVLTGGWGFYAVDIGEFIFEAVKNFLFFIPLMILYFVAFESNIRFSKCIKKSLLIVFCLLLFIEMNQLFFKVGEFQLEDLVYNTTGAVVGGCMYVFMKKIKNFRKSS